MPSRSVFRVYIYSGYHPKSASHTNFHPGQSMIRLYKDKGAWSTNVPVLAKSLLLGPANIYLAGVRDEIDVEDPWSHYDGKQGALLMIYSKDDGRLKRVIELASPPVFDGLAAAGKKLFVSCRDGSILCFE